MRLRKRYFVLMFLGFLPFYKLFHYDNYCFGDKDLLIVALWTVVFIIAFLAIVFQNLYTISIKKELLNVRPFIIAGVFFVALYVGLKFHDKNLFKTEVKTFKSILDKNSLLQISLFYDNTFEFKNTVDKTTCVEKGTYFIKKDTLFLNSRDKINRNVFLDSVYIINKTTNYLIPKDSSLPKLIIEK